MSDNTETVETAETTITPDVQTFAGESVNTAAEDWEYLTQAIATESAADYRLEEARHETNAAIRRAYHHPEITVADIAKVMGVSEATVRNRRNGR